MNYKIKILPKARKFIDKQQPKQKTRILKAIYQLPEIGDVIKLKGNDEYRLRIGDIRIIFEIHRNILTIIVTDTNNRGDVYKQY